MAISGPSDNVRLMAIEIVVADMLATVYQIDIGPGEIHRHKTSSFKVVL